MIPDTLKRLIANHTWDADSYKTIVDAVEAHSTALIAAKPIVSGSLRFSDWVKAQTDELKKAGDGYDGLSDLSKKCIDYAVDRYTEWLKAQ